MRVIPTTIPEFRTLGLPPQLEEVATLRDGIVLVTGARGAGKSSTLAALLDRIQKAGLPISSDDERLVKEISFFADRADISEELTRLESHLAQFAHHLRRNEPVGRTLEFITQEISRELNTLGAKANDAAITQRVVACKAELEKIREQVQNLE